MGMLFGDDSLAGVSCIYFGELLNAALCFFSIIFSLSSYIHAAIFDEI